MYTYSHKLIPDLLIKPYASVSLHTLNVHVFITDAGTSTHTHTLLQFYPANVYTVPLPFGQICRHVRICAGPEGKMFVL